MQNPFDSEPVAFHSAASRQLPIAMALQRRLFGHGRVCVVHHPLNLLMEMASVKIYRWKILCVKVLPWTCWAISLILPK